MRKILAIAGLMIVATAGHVQAGFVTYNNKAAFLSAISGLNQTLENFESQTIREFPGTGAINETGFNGFDLTGTQNGEQVGIRPGGTGGSPNGSKFLGWQQGNGGVGPVLNFDLTSVSTAFGFAWRDTDTTDEYALFINGFQFFNPPFSTNTGNGFFGVVATAGTTIAQATIRNTRSPGGYVYPFGVDDVYTAAAPVPEPASLAMWTVMGGIGFMVRRRRKKAIAS